jgi:hypothetical protein
MSKIRAALVLAAFLLLLPSLANAQCNSSTPLPPGTVLGRLLAGPGPCQAIPFATLNSNLVGNGFIQFAGPTAPTKTFTLPNVSGTLAMLSQIQTWTGQQTFVAPILGAATATTINGITITPNTGTLTLNTNTLGVAGAGVNLSIGGVTGKTFTFNNSLTLAGTDGTTQTFQASDTIVGRATTDTLTNKTFDTAGTGNSFSINGVAATANTGTGAVVRASGATLSATLTNSTLNGNVFTTGTGTLTIAAGKTATHNATTTFSGTDGSTLNVGAGGTLGGTAYATAGQLPGEPSTGSASAGNVGEFTSNTCASAAISTGTQTNCSTGLSLTAGDWDVQAVIYYSPSNASTNIQDFYCSVSLTSATLDQTTFNFIRVSYGTAGVVPGLSVINTAVCPMRRVSVSSTTPVFAVAFVDFTVSTMQFSGGIRARRVR